jgi:protein SCO1
MLDRRRFFLAGAALAALAPLPAAAAFVASGKHADKTKMGYYTNVELTTHDGRTVRFYDDLIKDKIVLINFMYTNCTDICPGMTQNLIDVQRMLGGRVGTEFFFYSLTLQPEVDTPEVLRQYVEEQRIGPGWTFLTGRKDDTEMLRRRLGFADLVPSVDADQNEHTGVVRLGNEKIDRWAASPALADPEVIVDSLIRLQRVGQSIPPTGLAKQLPRIEPRGPGHEHHHPL